MIDFIARTDADGRLQVDTGPSDEVHIETLVHFCKGWNKFAPFVGACLPEELHDQTETAALYGRIRHELTNDGAELQDFTLLASDSEAFRLRLAAVYKPQPTHSG